MRELRAMATTSADQIGQVERKTKRLFRALAHGLELALVFIFVFAAVLFGNGPRAVANHSLFAVCTMAFVNCVDCWKCMNERYEFLGELLGHCGSRLPENFRLRHRLSRMARGWYTLFTTCSAVCWVVAALFYCTTMAQLHSHKINELQETQSWSGADFGLGFFAACSFLLAAWKVWDVSDAPTELEISEILAAIEGRSETENGGGGKVEGRGNIEGVSKPR